MRGAVVLVLLAAMVCAQDAKNFKRAFEMILKGGAVPKANELLHDQFVTWLAENPEPARAVCEAAANAVRKTSKRYPSDWEDIVAKLVRATDQMGDADTEELAARAEALLCRARFNDDPNRSPGPEDWLTAAALYEKADAVDDEDGLNLERAAHILREGAGSGVAQSDEMRAKATALCEQGAKRFPKREFFREIVHRDKLAAVRRLVKDDKKQAKKLLEDYLKSLQPQAFDPKAFSPTFFNDVVTLCKLESKLGVKAKYRTRELKFKNLVRFDTPEGKRWKWKGGTLYQYGSDGLLLRTFNFDQYDWDTVYVVDAKEFGGDNIKGLARMGEADVQGVVLKVKKRKNLRRKKLNRHIPHSQAFTIAGIDEDGDYLCFHNYYFKCKKTSMRTVEVSILELGDFKKLDPEAKFVLDSIRE
ncbi:MAG: hypothetical protein ACYTGN_15155 [Planctomycetota bacterium]|jgi:ketosteroid isomerase-like protein